MNYLINMFVAISLYCIMHVLMDPNALMTAIISLILMNVGDQITKKAIEKP